MKKREISIGKVYAVKVSGNISPVKIEGESVYGGWNGVNLKTLRAVRIHSASKLRYEIEAIPNGWRKVGQVIPFSGGKCA